MCVAPQPLPEINPPALPPGEQELWQSYLTVEQFMATNNMAGIVGEERVVLANLGFFARMSAAEQEWFYEAFAKANTTLDRHAAALPWYERLIKLLGSPEVQRFRSQGKHVCLMGSCLMELGDLKAARTEFLKARKLAEAHGFFQVRLRRVLLCHP